MTLNQFTFETGPEGGSLNNGNSGSIAASLGGGTTAFATAMAAHGTFGARFANVAGASTYRRWPLASSTTTFQFSGVLVFPGVPSQTIDVAAFVNAGAARRLVVRILDTGQIRLVDAGSNSYPLVPAGAISEGTKVRITIQAVGGSTTASTVHARAYVESAPGRWDAQVGNTVSVGNANMNTDQLIGIDVGLLTAAAGTFVVGWDDLQLNDGTGTEIPDYSAPTPTPIANAGSHQTVLPGAIVQLNGSGSTNATNYQWSYVYPVSDAPTLSAATTSSPSFTAGTNGAIYALQLEVGNGASTSTAIVHVSVGTTAESPQEKTWTGSAWV